MRQYPINHSLLQDFLDNPAPYNANSIIKSIVRMVETSSRYTGGLCNIQIADNHDDTSLRDVVQYVIDNPQPKEKIENAIDVMVSGWERAKLMDLLMDLIDDNNYLK